MKKRKDGRYSTQIVVGYLPNGKRKVKTIYGRTRKEVETKAREVRNNIDNGIDYMNEHITIEEWGSKWLKVYKNNVAPGTFAMYEQSLRNHIIPTIGKIPMAKLKPIQIQEALNNIINTGHIRTAEIYKLTIKQIVRQAVDEGIIAKNICDNLEKIKSSRTEKRVLTDFELACISKTDYSDRERLFLDVLYYTGIRRGEALALSIADINWDRRTLHIGHSLDISNNKPILKEPKTKAGFRDIPIPAPLYSELKAYVAKDNTLYLFSTSKKGLMTRSAFRRMWDNIMRKTKETAKELLSCSTNSLTLVSDHTIAFSPHTFRHTYATNLYYADIDLKRCQYLLGHSTIDMTLRVYTHLDNKNNDKSAEKIEQFFSQSKVSQTRFMP